MHDEGRRSDAVATATGSSSPGATIALFLAACLVYRAARSIFAGELPLATKHAEWIVDVERAAGVAVGGSVQRALDSGVAIWLLSNVYLAAQLAVLPGALIWLYHRSRAAYRELRDTVVASWLIAVPIFAVFAVAPARLADIGLLTPSQTRRRLR
jgi:PAP2 superfamily